MKKYLYVAKSKDGVKKEGFLEAESREEIAETLKKEGFTPVIIKEKNNNILLRGFSIGRVKSQDKVIFSKELSTLVSAGIPISQSMNILEEQAENKTMKAAAQDISQEIEGGLSLSAAMNEHPKVFNPFYVNMVKAGEIGGSLDETLKKLADEIEKEHELIAKIRGALIYPTVIIVTLVMVVAYLLTNVIPKIAEVFTELGGELPVSTKFLIGLSDFVIARGFIIVIILASLVFGLRFLVKKNDKSKYIWNQILLKLPVAGKLIKKINITRFTRTLGSLLGSGVAVLEALDIAANTLNNEVFKREIRECIEKVKGGSSMGATLRTSKVFPTMVPQMISVGEETGTLDDILLKLNDFYEKEVDHTVKNLQGSLEPIIMILIGLGTGFIVISVIQPIYSMTALF